MFTTLLRARAHLFALALLLAAAVQASHAAPAADRLPVADFFKSGDFSGAVLSPNGRHIAAAVSIDDSPRMLVVLPLDSRKPQVLVRSTSDVADFRWVSDSRIAYTLRARGSKPGDNDLGPGLFAIDIDGKDARQLASRALYIVRESSAVAQRMLPYNTGMNRSLGRQDSDAMFVNVARAAPGGLATVDLLRLDSRTGQSSTFARPGNTVGWLLDETSEPRIAITSDGKSSSLHYREPGTDAWRKVGEMENNSRDGFEPLAFGPDGRLYVSARNGRDKAALYRYDLQKGAIVGEPLVSLDHYDFNGAPLFRNGKLAGVYYVGDAASIHWLDEDMQRLQKRVDEQLPATNNLITYARRPETPYMLVNAYSDVDPGSTYLLNSQTGELSLLGKARPHIDPARMAALEPVRIKVRDGLDMPAWLTLPRHAQKNLPLVVLVHGGPWVRGTTWGWNPAVQFLASRGYAVLEPEFRGSTGYGWKHFEAGFKQWGLAMQDDVTDAARWAVAQGYADPQRICIAGASYGGYAALMGVLKEPEVFRCAINWVGVTDINLLYNAHWSDTSDAFRAFGMPKLVGDQQKDAALLKANSPLEHAERIRRPLLLAYGASDVRVPLEHGTRFRDAVLRHHQDVEWVAYAGEGHGWATLTTNVDFWTRVEKFLARHIGPQADKK